MPRGKSKPKFATLDFYGTLSSGSHVFLFRCLECLSFNASQLSEIKYAGFVLEPLNDLEAFSQERKGRETNLLSESFPMGGFGFIRRSQNRRSSLEGCKDRCFVFDSVTKHPVYAGTVSFMSHEYREYSVLIRTSMIAAYDEKEACEFIDEYMAARRQRSRKRECVLNWMGEPISNFRKMSWENIFLPGEMLQDIRSEIDAFFGNAELYKKHSLDWRRGILLAGPPGNGKTAIARAIATTAKVPVVYCSVGQSEPFELLDQAAATIARNTPCIAIMEDADALGGDEGPIRAMLLNILDGLFTSNGVLTIATTNSPDKLDAAFTARPSRFDSYYIIPDPATAEREKVLRARLGDAAKDVSKDEVQEIVAGSNGLSAACVQEIAVCAMLTSLVRKKPLSIEHLREALLKVKTHVKASKTADKWARGSIGFGPPDAGSMPLAESR
jgi:hypothetical protein